MTTQNTPTTAQFNMDDKVIFTSPSDGAQFKGVVVEIIDALGVPMYRVELQGSGKTVSALDENLTHECFVPDPERDNPPCDEMAAQMERWIERQRWFIFEDEYEAIDRLNEEIARLHGLIPGGPA